MSLSPPNAIDEHWMQRAIQLARMGQGSVEPNPMVGCVIVKNGDCIAEGYHRRFGQAHAEVDALQRLQDRSQAREATAYVTLEPCCHVGKTPPCTEALIAAGVARVVAAMRDPFPKVDGGGLRQLQEAGIQVDVGVLQSQAEELNAPYLKRLTHRCPWVIAKWAMSIDGKIATATGDSQWISNELSRGEVHRLRGRVDAIIVGGGTAAIDNPTLTARPPGQRIATRIVVVGKRLPSLQSKLLATVAEAPLLFAITTEKEASLDQTHLRALENAGAEILWLSKTNHAVAEPRAARAQQVRSLLQNLGDRNFTNVLVEGGAALLASFADADELDEIHAYVCPKIVGGENAPGPIGGAGISQISLGNRFERSHVTLLDDDVRITLRRARRLSAGPTF